VGLKLGVAEAVGVAVAVGVGLTAGEAVKLGDGVGLWLGVAVGEGGLLVNWTLAPTLNAGDPGMAAEAEIVTHWGVSL
jgi:hypothetical protein